MRDALIVATALLSLFATVGWATDESEIQEYELSNGMKILLWPDDTIPNLALYTFWKVGSRNEYPGTTGMAHFFEHMMFNGSKNYEPGEFDRTMEAAGGANNAYTSKNVTVYTDWIPAMALEITLDLERDRIGFLKVDPEVVESERGVVYSERRRSLEDDNHGLMWEQLYAAAYMAHPYSWPVLGWRSDIENWRQEDLEEFFRVWYSPNNAVLVLCGAFDADSAFALLESKLGSLPLRAKGVEIRAKEPAQSGERRVELRKEAGLGSVLIGFHIPETSHDDIRAIELLDLILSEGESSRLYRRLVDQDELALRVDCDTDNNFDPGMFEILVQSRESIEGPPIEAAVYEELARVAGEGVSDAELEKARNMLLTDFYREMATISGRADALGSFELFHGGWRELFNISDRYEAVTSEDLQRVTRQYLNANNRTVVTLIPTDTTEAGDRDAR
jgi:zinc protease